MKHRSFNHSQLNIGCIYRLVLMCYRAEGAVMRFTSSSSMLLLQLMGIITMMTNSADATVCHNCSSLTDTLCAFNASFSNGECTGNACFVKYDASLPGG